MSSSSQNPCPSLAKDFRHPIRQLQQEDGGLSVAKSMKNSSPVILISGSTEQRGAEFGDISLSLSMNYPIAIKAGGGMPWLLPCVPERDLIADAVHRSDGVLLTGGDDVQPKLYSQKLSPNLAKTVHPASPERDLFELMLIEEIFAQRKPLLAICRGHQILNVALGGDLMVDIKTQKPAAANHCQMDQKNKVVHDVSLKDGSLLADIVRKPQLGVNSTHHQAVGKIAKPLSATAVSIDGIIEGMELAQGSRHILPWLLAVQFHPERLFRQHAEHLEIFKRFIQVCRPVRRTV